jgi:hypothetical protein
MAVEATHLTTSFNEADASSYATASISPTASRALENIKNQGLNPSAGQYGKGVYFAPTEELTRGYGSLEEVMLRVNRSKLPKDWQEFPEQGWTKKNIPKESIEIKIGKTWEPLSTQPKGVGGVREYPKIYHATTKQNVESLNAMGVRSDLKKLYFTSDENIAKGYGEGIIALNENHFQVLPSTSPRAKAMFEKAGVDPSVPHINDKLMNILKSEGYDGIKYPTAGGNWDYEIFNTTKINKSIKNTLLIQSK